MNGICQAQDDHGAQFQKDADQALSMWQDHWQHARAKEEKRRLGGELYKAAIQANRPDIAEDAVAGGAIGPRQIQARHPIQRVPLHVIRVFDDLEVKPDDAYDEAPNEGGGWLARRITHAALEVWTPTHGWLFDGKGHLLNEARPGRQGDDTGREWYGAFLPDGRWVTTDVNNIDNSLVFFSREGQFIKALSCEDLAPLPSTFERDTLLGWARSNKEGTAWIVNVGSEEGYATVRVGPEGPAQRLFGMERWQACYPRALGARGSYLDMWVPDDPHHLLMQRSGAGHGPNVGFPGYSVFVPKSTAGPDSLSDEPSHDRETGGSLNRSPLGSFLSVPEGNYLFGFWPGRQDIFIGALRPASGLSRTYNFSDPSKPRDENATWFFNARGEFRGWLRGRRLADAADGQAMLFRLEDSQEVLTLLPSLRAAQVRRFVWTDGKTATALSLFDDLHRGLFRKDSKLVLAEWR